jgi:hypothetical protein
VKSENNLPICQFANLPICQFDNSTIRQWG